ncbi:HigA family addiction module antitoxin [Luteibacter sp. 3190]|uniref:HigA family addiction module antitoxin n=1 Tax=Luteibacter sp. 3190 TaxID=2817736 RepID=UPI002864144E|nr:HigA family addiction module antitoxin [Luteibacter sp. 3190]MDR6934809.1 addiction module HigA family antidote [Luteibacter sp. 3190]
MREFPFPHPGEVLEEEFLKPLALTKYRLAKAIDVPAARIGEIIAGRRAITADTGLRLSRFFGLSDWYWTGLQHDYDREMTRQAMADTLAAIVPLAELSKGDAGARRAGRAAPPAKRPPRV